MISSIRDSSPNILGITPIKCKFSLFSNQMSTAQDIEGRLAMSERKEGEAKCEP